MGRGDARQFSGGGQFGMRPPPDYRENTVNRCYGSWPAFHVRPVGNARQQLGAASMGKAGEDSGVSSRTGTPAGAEEIGREGEEKKLPLKM